MFVINRYKQMTLNIGDTIFYEKINITKLNYILNNRSKYESIITEQEKERTSISILLQEERVKTSQPIHPNQLIIFSLFIFKKK